MLFIRKSVHKPVKNEILANRSVNINKVRQENVYFFFKLTFNTIKFILNIFNVLT